MIDDERCKGCGDEIEKDELGWFCRGCDLRTDSRGRKSARQPPRGQKALRRFHGRAEQKAAEAIEAVFGEGVTDVQQKLFRGTATRVPYVEHRRIPNFEEPPRLRHRFPPLATGKLWCKPCDALFVRRAGRTMCWRCGVIWEAS